jgi:BetI-type transcriptional repressor, C-terminal
MGQPRSAKRAAREATEAAMLTAATRMLLESPATDVLATLKPVEIARRSVPPRTTGAFYNIWPTQADFRRAVLDHVLSLDRFPADRATTEQFDALLDRPDLDVEEAVRVTANLAFEGQRTEPAVRLQLALWTQVETDPEVRERLELLYSDISDSLVPRYVRLLERSGRRMSPPFTPETLAVALTALVEGLHLRWAVDPDAVTDDLGTPPGVTGVEERRWSTFAALVRVLLAGMTEPI